MGPSSKKKSHSRIGKWSLQGVNDTVTTCHLRLWHFIFGGTVPKVVSSLTPMIMMMVMRNDA